MKNILTRKPVVTVILVSLSIGLFLIAWLYARPAFPQDNPFEQSSVTGGESLTIDEDSVRWLLTNNTSDDLSIETIDISWPQESGNLRQIVFNGRIFKGQRTAPTATFVVADLGKEKHRTLKTGKSRELQIKFDQENPLATQDQFVISVSFDDGTVVQFDDSIVEPPASDTTPPVITLLGDNPLTLNVGDVFRDPGATATDDVDGDITSAIIATSNVDTDVVSEYEVTYDVVDGVGNPAVQISRIVSIQEPSSPIKILPSTPIIDSSSPVPDTKGIKSVVNESLTIYLLEENIPGSADEEFQIVANSSFSGRPVATGIGGTAFQFERSGENIVTVAFETLEKVDFIIECFEQEELCISIPYSVLDGDRGYVFNSHTDGLVILETDKSSQ